MRHVLFPGFVLAAALLGACVSRPSASPPPVLHPNVVSPSAARTQGETINEADTLTPTLRFMPHYSLEAGASRRQGCVKTIFDVNPQGHPVHIDVRMAIPLGVFDKATVGTIKQWRFRSTRNGHPAWTYNVSQIINFFISGKGPYAGSARAQHEVSWLCDQPSAQPALIRPASPPFDNAVAIATYGDETVVYVPDLDHTALKPGSGKIRFCVDERGNIADAHVLSGKPNRRYGLLTIAVLQARSFTPFEPNGSPQKVCHLTWPLSFVTAPPQQRLPVVPAYDPQDPDQALRIMLLPAAALAPNAASAAAFAALSFPRTPLRAELCINTDGHTGSVKLTRSSGSTRFDALALHALDDFRFFAQRNDKGEPIASCGWRVAIRFDLERSIESMLESTTTVAK